MEMLNPWLALLGLVLPLIVAAVTKSDASSTVKGWTLAALSGVGAVVTAIVEGGLDLSGLDFPEMLNNLLLIFASSVVAYKGGLVKDAARKVQSKTVGKGIGKHKPVGTSTG